MQKQWYETALTLVILGCSGTTAIPNEAQGGTSVDAGTPLATGGIPTVRYGVIVTGGTKTSIDTGTPRQTGGAPTDLYGVLGTGGRSGVVAYYGPLVQGGGS